MIFELTLLEVVPSLDEHFRCVAQGHSSLFALVLW